MGSRAVSTRAENGDNIPLTEPETVPCLLVTGAAIDTAYGIIRIVGWNHCPVLTSETEERRIVVRMALTESAARNLARELQRVLYGGMTMG